VQSARDHPLAVSGDYHRVVEEAYFDEPASALICSASFADYNLQNYCAHVAAALSRSGVDGEACCGCAFAGGDGSNAVAAAGHRIS